MHDFLFLEIAFAVGLIVVLMIEIVFACLVYRTSKLISFILVGLMILQIGTVAGFLTLCDSAGQARPMGEGANVGMAVIIYLALGIIIFSLFVLGACAVAAANLFFRNRRNNAN